MKLNFLIFSMFMTCFLTYGQLKQENIFDNQGKKHGFWRFFDKVENRIVFEGNYLHGTKHGVFTSYHKSGLIKDENNFSEGVFHGVQKHYNESSILIWTCNYNKGVKDGVEKRYYPNGAIKIIINYVDGNISGNQKYYDEKGNVLPFTFDKIK